MIIRIGTRKSMLAMAQTSGVAAAIQSILPNSQIEIVPIITSGDRYFGPLNTIGGKGLFTAELESALREGRIDIAVHSAKDMPAAMSGDFSIVAVPPRADARDTLISAEGFDVAGLPQSAVVGTSSPRRSMQMLAARADLKIVPLRGNVETRIKKVQDKVVHATLLAMAGLERANLVGQYQKMIRPLEIEFCVPAAGQGTLAIQGLALNRTLSEMLSPLDHKPSRESLLAERAVVQKLKADCHSSLAVHFRQVLLDAHGGQHSEIGWQGMVVASHRDGSDIYRFSLDDQSVSTTQARISEVLENDRVADIIVS